MHAVTVNAEDKNSKLTLDQRSVIKSYTKVDDGKQECPVCGYEIGIIAGSKEAMCTNCGYKDPCCE